MTRSSQQDNLLLINIISDNPLTVSKAASKLYPLIEGKKLIVKQGLVPDLLNVTKFKTELKKIEGSTGCYIFPIPNGLKIHGKDGFIVSGCYEKISQLLKSYSDELTITLIIDLKNYKIKALLFCSYQQPDYRNLLQKYPSLSIHFDIIEKQLKVQGKENLVQAFRTDLFKLVERNS